MTNDFLQAMPDALSTALKHEDKILDIKNAVI